MSKKISELPSITLPTSVDELVVNQGGVSKKISIADLLMSGSFDTEESLMAMPFRNPHKFLIFYDDFNILPEITISNGLPAPAPGTFTGWLANGQGIAQGQIYTALTGAASVNSSISMDTGTAANDDIVMVPNSFLEYGPSWAWRMEDDMEFVVACGFTWGVHATSTYKIGGGAHSVPESLSVFVQGAGPRFESIDGETLKFRWGTQPSPVGYELDTGVSGGGGSGNTQGGETAMHTFLAHHKNNTIRIFVDGVLTATQSNRVGGTIIDGSFLMGCGDTAAGKQAFMNIDYFLIAVQRAGQLLAA